MSIGDVIFISIGMLALGIAIGMGIQIIFMSRNDMIKEWAYPKLPRLLKKIFKCRGDPTIQNSQKLYFDISGLSEIHILISPEEKYTIKREEIIRIVKKIHRNRARCSTKQK